VTTLIIFLFSIFHFFPFPLLALLILTLKAKFLLVPKEELAILDEFKEGLNLFK